MTLAELTTGAVFEYTGVENTTTRIEEKMSIDTNKVRKLSELDDNEFSSAVYIIATAMGLPPAKAAEASKNTAFFKTILGNASDKDIKNMLGKLSPEQMNDIDKILPRG